jgi:hypothetical protein
VAGEAEDAEAGAGGGPVVAPGVVLVAGGEAGLVDEMIGTFRTLRIARRNDKSLGQSISVQNPRTPKNFPQFINGSPIGPTDARTGRRQSANPIALDMSLTIISPAIINLSNSAESNFIVLTVLPPETPAISSLQAD